MTYTEDAKRVFNMAYRKPPSGVMTGRGLCRRRTIKNRRVAAKNAIGIIAFRWHLCLGDVWALARLSACAAVRDWRQAAGRAAGVLQSWRQCDVVPLMVELEQ